MAQVNAKFRCETVIKGVDVETPTLRAVYGDGLNAQWAKYTPSGSIQMQIDNPGAQGFFQPGKEYIVMFWEAGADE